jgi:phage shock protein A
VREAIHVTREALKPMAPPRPAFSAPPRPEAPLPPRPRFRDGNPATLFSRTRDVIAANFADLLDRAEEPAKMIRMVVMEMEDALAQSRAGSARALAEAAELRARIRHLAATQASWVQKAELAVAKGRDDLARAALVEKQKAAAAADRLAEQIEAMEEGLSASGADVARLEAKLREARTRWRAVQARNDNAARQARLREMHSGPRVDEAFYRFALLDRRVDEAEARAEALALGAPPRTLEEELAELRTADRVEADLASLKARVAPRKEG